MRIKNIILFSDEEINKKKENRTFVVLSLTKNLSYVFVNSYVNRKDLKMNSLFFDRYGD